MIDNLEHWSPIGKSDHSILVFDYICYTMRNNRWQYKYNFNKGDFDSIKENLKIDWESKLDTFKSIEEKWIFFRKVLLNEIETHIPLRKFGNKAKKKQARLVIQY